MLFGNSILSGISVLSRISVLFGNSMDRYCVTTVPVKAKVVSIFLHGDMQIN